MAFTGPIVMEAMRFAGRLGAMRLRPADDLDRRHRVVFAATMSVLSRMGALRGAAALAPAGEHAGVADAEPEVNMVTRLKTWFTRPGRCSRAAPSHLKMMLAT